MILPAVVSVSRRSETDTLFGSTFSAGRQQLPCAHCREFRGSVMSNMAPAIHCLSAPATAIWWCTGKVPVRCAAKILPLCSLHDAHTCLQQTSTFGSCHSVVCSMCQHITQHQHTVHTVQCVPVISGIDWKSWRGAGAHESSTFSL